MRKPTKTPKEIREDSSLLSSYCSYSPEDLMSIANYMIENGIMYLGLEITGHDGYLEPQAVRMETPEEVEKRYNKEIKEWAIYKEKQKVKKEKRKMQLIQEAKKLGLKVEE